MRFLAVGWRIGLMLALLLAPTQWSLHFRERAHITIVEPLLAVTALAWGLDALRGGRWRNIRLPPMRQCLFLLLAALSLGVAADRVEALKTLVQFVLYFGVLHVLILDAARQHPEAPRIGLALVLAAAAVNLGLALFQYFNPETDGFYVRGAFSNRNVLGGYLALLIPVCAGIALYDRQPFRRILAGILIAAGMLVMLSGAAFVAITAAVGAGLLYARRGLAFAFLVIVAILAVDEIFPRLPRNNEQEFLESVALYDGMATVNYRYPEWQAAVIMILEHPWRGVGAGNYQRNINRYYGIIPNPTGPQEPDIQNLYLVLGGTLGLPGLAAFLAMMAMAIRDAGISLRRNLKPETRALVWGGACALVAFAIAAVFSPLLVRGIVPLTAALLAAHSP